MNFRSTLKIYSSGELITESKKYINRIKRNNNFFLIIILFYLGLFPKIKIYITDLKKYYKFDIVRGLKETTFKNTDSFVSFSSENLSFIFCYDYGFDTLQVNARLKCNEVYFKKITKCFIISSLNNTGRYIKIFDFYKYLNLDFIIRGLEILNIKKKQYN